MELRISYVFTFLLLLFSCTNSKSVSYNSFEGIIKYSVSFDEGDRSKPAYYYDYIKQKYGDVALYHFKANGDFLRTYPYSGDKGVDFYLYKNDTKNFYAKWRNIDTLFYYNVTENMLQFTKEETGKSEIILGEQCSFYKISGIDTVGGQQVTQTYHFSGKPYIDPSLYEGYNDFFFSKIIKKTKSPFLKLILDMNYYKLEFTAKKIEEKELEDGLFKIPTGIPLKKY